MINLTKGAEPNILRDNKTAWTNELLGHIARGEKIPKSLASNYNQTEVKEALKIESKNKCMYCESNVSHVAHEHIEHIKPKAQNKFPELTFEWSNLGLACPVCNMNKGAEYDNDTPFINPYVDDPVDNFIAMGHFIYNKPNRPRAELTNRTIKLNRPELIEKRKERIESIIRLIERYHSMAEGALKEALLEEINLEIAEDKPYSMCSKSIVEAMINN